MRRKSYTPAALRPTRPWAKLLPTFTWLAGHSPQAGLHHQDIAQWARRAVAKFRSHQKAAASRQARRAQHTALYLAAGGSGRRGGRQNAGDQARFRTALAAAREGSTLLQKVAHVLAVRKAATRAARRQTHVQVQSAAKWSEELERSNPGVSAALWRECRTALQHALRRPRCKITVPRKTTSKAKDRRGAVRKAMK